MNARELYNCHKGRNKATKSLRSLSGNLAISLLTMHALFSAQLAYPSPAKPDKKISNQSVSSQYDLKTMIRQAEILRGEGKFGDAAIIWKKILDFAEKAFGPEHLTVATSLSNLAGLLSDQGHYSSAKPLYERSLAIREKLLGLDHIDVALSLHNLGYLFQKQGHFDGARTLYQRSLKITEKALEANHPDVAVSLNNLAELERSQGRYGAAENLYRRSLAIFEKAMGANHLDVAKSLNNLAELARSQGQYAVAEPLYRRSLAILEKVRGGDHPDVAISLNNLALLQGDQGKYAEAEVLLRRSLAIGEKAIGADHPEVAISLNNLAALLHRQGRYPAAEQLYRRSLAIFENAFGTNHPAISTNLGNLAVIMNDQEKYIEAENISRRSLAIAEQALGPEHPEVAISLSYLSGLLIANGDNENAFSIIKRALAIQANWLLRELPLLPNQSRSLQLRLMGDAWERVFGWIARYSPAAQPALETRLNRQGLLQEIEQLQVLLLNAPGINTTNVEQLKTLTQQLTSVQSSAERRTEIRQQRDKLQAEIYRQIPDLELQLVTNAAVAQALPGNGALVEFQRYRPFDGRKPKGQRWGKPQYIALVLKPNGSISAVPLGPAAEIDAQVQKGLRASAETLSDAEAIWGQLSSQVIQPLLPQLGGSRQWFLSPDGELNRVPFAALPAPQQPDIPLAQVVQLRVLTTGRELVRLQQPAPAGSKALVMANPSYDRPGARSSPALRTDAVATATQRRSAEMGSNQWIPLPASEREGQQVASLLGTRIISGTAATTTALQRQQGPRVVHVATHGFFVADQESRPSEAMRSIQEGSPLLRSLRQEDPQLRSGLVLAGANQPDLDPNDDGYLTAAEAVNLNLKGTELVVLSACSTGQGDVRTGEGVYGLQRSLTVAGARSTLLSLWKVDDAATAEFMQRFYQRLKAGEGRSDALAAVQQEFRSGKVQSPNGANWKEPFYWAAWQLVGDWRPIKGL